MKTTVAAAVLAVAALESSRHCVRAFFVGAPVGTGASFAGRAWAPPSAACAAGPGRGCAAAAGLSMVSATFGEKINTDRIVLDKTAREAIAEQYPEACAKCPQFLGEDYVLDVS